jgi:hypothetical protein
MEIQLHASYSQQETEVSGKIHAPAALRQGTQFPVPIVQEDVWAPEPIWNTSPCCRE